MESVAGFEFLAFNACRAGGPCTCGADVFHGGEPAQVRLKSPAYHQWLNLLSLP